MFLTFGIPTAAMEWSSFQPTSIIKPDSPQTRTEPPVGVIGCCPWLLCLWSAYRLVQPQHPPPPGSLPDHSSLSTAHSWVCSVAFLNFHSAQRTLPPPPPFTCTIRLISSTRRGCVLSLSHLLGSPLSATPLLPHQSLMLEP